MYKQNNSKIEVTVKNYNHYKILKTLNIYLRKTGNSYQEKKCKNYHFVIDFLFFFFQFYI